MSLTKGALIQPQGLTTTERDLLTLSGGDIGRLIYNETTSKLQQWTGSAWVDVLTSTAGSTPVSSVFGRTGAVVATEGDYDLDELGDVSVTGAAVGSMLELGSGGQWVAVTEILGGTY